MQKLKYLWNQTEKHCFSIVVWRCSLDRACAFYWTLCRSIWCLGEQLWQKTQPAFCFCCMSSFMAELWEAWVSLQTCFPFWQSHRVTLTMGMLPVTSPLLTDMAFFECPGGVNATLELLMRAAEAAETRTGVAMGCLEQANKVQCHDMSWLFFCYFWVII